jgi:hypothetical protein
MVVFLLKESPLFLISPHTCTWLDIVQAAELHVLYTAGYYSIQCKEVHICTWLDIVPGTEVHVLGWILYRSQRYMYNRQLATIQCTVQRDI